jgi:hypothetical protein
VPTDVGRVVVTGLGDTDEDERLLASLNEQVTTEHNEVRYFLCLVSLAFVFY